MGLFLLSLLTALAQDPAQEGGAGVDTPPAGAADAPASTSSPGDQLPLLVDAPPPPYPPAALAAGREAAVVLEILVSESGEVVEAVVVDATDDPDGFEQAARLAIRGYRFTPATDEAGTPVSMVLRFRVQFRVDAVPPPSVEGTAREAGIRAPLEGLEVTARGPDDQQAFALTGADGTFVLRGLSPGDWSVTVEGPALRPLTQPVTVRDDRVQTVAVYLVRDSRADALQGGETLVVVGERASAEVSERRLTREEVQDLPGSAGDVVKVIQNLPGVARAPLGTGNLIIRGTAPEDSAYFLDGSPIPLVFHFGGLTSVINSDSIAEVAYLSGNPSVRYGRVLGGLVDLRTTTNLPERSRGYVSVDLYQATAFVEQKLGETTALAISGRRSYIDALLSPLLSSGSLRVQAPRYYDTQLRFFHRQDSGTTWDALFFLSDDQFRFLGVSEDEEETLAAFSDRFSRGRLRRLGPVAGSDWTSETTLAFGPKSRDFSFGNGVSGAYERRLSLSLRQELSLPVTPERRTGTRFGLDLVGGRDAFFFDEARFSDAEEDEGWFASPAVYGEVTQRFGPLTIIPGVRSDALLYDTGYTGWAVDPRGTVRLRLGDRVTLKAASGRYSSLPTLRQVSPSSDGNPDLTLPRSWQSSAGAELTLNASWRVDAVAFYNRLDDLVVGREDRLRFFSGPPPIGPFDTDPYANDGVGLVCGSEYTVRFDGPTAVGLLALTWSHSERQDRPDEPVELFVYDQPIVLNALWSQQLPKNWRVGGRVRLSSGNPYTPVVNRIFDQQDRTFVPVYGARSSERPPPFFSFDLRFDKTYTFRKWKLGTYLDIQNATVSQNIEVVQFTYDYRDLDPITSNPPLPIFGFKGEW